MLKPSANSAAPEPPGNLILARRSLLWCVVGPVLCAAGLCVAAGCSTRDDPAFNPFAPATGGRTALETLDDVVNQAQQAVDNFDRRLENAAY